MSDLKQKQETSVVWTSSGGDEGLTLTSLADGAGRQGDGHDFGATFPQVGRLELQVQHAAQPTESVGNRVELFWSSSQDGTNYDGECSGSDGTFTVAKRNRLRRLVRESFRQRRSSLPPVDLVVLARRDTAGAANSQLRDSLELHWKRLAGQCGKS